MAGISVSSFFDAMEYFTVKELDRIKRHIEHVIEQKKPNDRKVIGALDINNYVSSYPNFINDSEILSISDELQSCKHFKLGGNGTQSLWLSDTEIPYKWSSNVSGLSTIKDPFPLKDFKNIQLLLEKINFSMGISLNACLIQYYPNGAIGIRIHDDFDWEMDQTQPFVNVTIGSPRKIDFFHNYQKASESPLKVITAKNGSMYTMNRDCQKYFKHRVPACGANVGHRFNLSFRCVLDLENVPFFHVPYPKHEAESWYNTPIKAPAPSGKRLSTSPWSSPRSLPALPRGHAKGSPFLVPAEPSAPPIEGSPIPAQTKPSAPAEGSPIPAQTEPSAPPAEGSPFPTPTEPSAPPAEVSPIPALTEPSTPPAEVSPIPVLTEPSAPPAEGSPIPAQADPSAPPAEGSPVPPSTNPPESRFHHIGDKRDITVLFGTSITRHLDSDLVSNNNTEFINVSVSGARIKNNNMANNIPDMATMLRDFAGCNPDKVKRVSCVIFSCGTNDIKHLRSKQLGPLYKPLCDLVSLTRRYFGHRVEICFQSVLPMRIMYKYTVENFLNFNRLLKSICCQCDCTYIDWFRNFLDYEGFDINRAFYADPFHLNRLGISTLTRRFFEFIRNRGPSRLSWSNH